ncbi:cupin domain-containing protein [Spirosoma rhododendri]|uniref:Cupin domain-containing protein n=1 Tax=Spirosoma rhododendri TaxID=2728024 RepID=A0A7L5DWK8_9BACT|nr:cupin domain-containing protein [Spirosoma rhododendri]QJD80367.1 cupin domain-containing protein [Spirosoma rhododendri]
MQRANFLKASLATATLLASPFVWAADTLKRYRVDKGFKVDAGKDRFNQAISLFDGDTFMTKVSTKDTNGDLYVYESRRVKEGGPALHVHFEQDELWYVLEGEFLIKVGDVIHQVKAGDTVFGPRNVPHCFAKVGSGEGRLLMTFQPAGKMEECFQQISAGVLKTMNEAQQDAFREAHGFKRVGPPINQLKQ